MTLPGSDTRVVEAIFPFTKKCSGVNLVKPRFLIHKSQPLNAMVNVWKGFFTFNPSCAILTCVLILLSGVI